MGHSTGPNWKWSIILASTFWRDILSEHLKGKFGATCLSRKGRLHKKGPFSRPFLEPSLSMYVTLFLRALKQLLNIIKLLVTGATILMYIAVYLFPISFQEPKYDMSQSNCSNQWMCKRVAIKLAGLLSQFSCFVSLHCTDSGLYNFIINWQK